MTECSEKDRFVTIEKDIKEISRRLGKGDVDFSTTEFLLKNIDLKLDDTNVKIDRVEAQTTKTNGRVTKAEDTIQSLEEREKRRNLIFKLVILAYLLGIFTQKFGILEVVENFFAFSR